MKLPGDIVLRACVCGGEHTSTGLEWNRDRYRRRGPASIIIKPFVGIFSTEFIVDMVPVDVMNVVLMKIGIANDVHEGIKAGLGFSDSAIPKPISKRGRTSIGVGIVVGWSFLVCLLRRGVVGKIFDCEVVIRFICRGSGQLISPKQTEDVLCRCKDPLYR